MRRMMPLARSVVGLPRRGVAAVLLAAWLLAAGLLGTDSPAAAQAVTTFISNTEQSGGITFSVQATAFDTGSSTYTLSSVGIYTLVPTGSTTPAVAIYGDNGGKPGTLLATMTMRASTIIRSGVSTFTAPAGTTLSASTTYWVVTSNSAATDGQGFRVGVINNATPDSSAAAGWSIGSARSKSDITDTSWTGTSFRILFQIRGTVRSTTNAPTVANAIPDQAATVATPFSYMFPMNTFNDMDGDALSYTATEPDDTALPTWLAFADTTRIFSGTPATGDVGTVSVKVTASDGNGGSVSDTFDIEVSAAADTTPPTLSSSVIDSAGLTLHLVFSENLEQSTPPLSSAFTVTADADVVTVSIDALDPLFPERIPISVSPTIFRGQTVVVTYTAATGGDDANAIQDIAGNAAATFTTGSGGVPAVTNFSTVVAATAPGAPTGLTATASGTTTINLSWTAPASNGGSAITGYKIEVSSDDGMTWTDLVADTNSPATTYPHTGLAAGATRHYRVSAINTAGTGASSGTDSATVGTTPTAPAAPTGLTATAGGTTTINLSWTAPGNNGGSPITGYKIEVSSDDGMTWTDLVADTTSPATTYPHTGLAAGDTRHYRVSAINTAGTGASSRIDTATTGTTGNGGGGGGGGPSGPTPSEVDFEWSVTRDIEELDSGHDKPSGLWSDGATLWILENGDGADDAIYAYDLATGERVEGREFELDNTNRAPRGVWSDRTVLWVSDSGRNLLFAHDLASGERLPERDLALADRNRDARGIWSDEERIWVLDGGKDSLFAYDLATGDLLAEYALDSTNGDPRGIWSDGVTFWVSDHGAKRLFAYRLETGEDGEAELERNRDEEFPNTILSRASNNSSRGIWSDGDIMYVADESDDKVYTYNMPDAIDARLASLTLSGVDFGEFEPGATEYEGTAGEGVTQTTVEATTVQRRTDVAFDPPPDADPDTAGHQVALQGVEEITVTVTSADGSRTKTYRVAFKQAVAEISLDAGWNTFTWPGADGVAIADALRGDGDLANDISATVAALYGWDEEAGAWLAFFPGLGDVPRINTLATLDQGGAYWIAVTEAVTWTVPALTAVAEVEVEATARASPSREP